MDNPADGLGFDWKGTSATAKWITPLRNHLKEGGSSDLRDKSGLVARVVGEVGFTPAGGGSRC